MTKIFSRLTVPKPNAAIDSIRLTARIELLPEAPVAAEEMAFAAAAAVDDSPAGGSHALADPTAEIEVETAA